jgi:hypothetical protein
MIDSEERLEKIRKFYRLLDDFFHLNDFSEQDAIDTATYYILIAVTANKIHPDEVDKLFDCIKKQHRELMEEHR